MNQSATLSTREQLTKTKCVPEVNYALDAPAQLLTQSMEDQHLTERVERALRARGYRALHAVRVSVRARVVFLRGRVGSYYLKQLAQETVLTVPGSHRIRNDLTVHPHALEGGRP